MAHNTLKQIIFTGALCAGAAFALTGCIDDSYDLDKVDLTMGLGSDGLAVRIGNTEKIYLKDILSLDENVDTTKQNPKGLYYLVENGTTNFHLEVDPVNVTIDNADLEVVETVLSYAEAARQTGYADYITSLTIPANQTYTGEAKGNNHVKFRLDGDDGITDDIVQVSEVNVRNAPVSLTLRVVPSSARLNGKFNIDKLTDFTITLPPYLTINNVSSDWVLEGNVLKTRNRDYTPNSNGVICQATITQAVLGSHGIPQTDADGKRYIELPEEQTGISMDGTVTFRTAAGEFTMQSGDYFNVELNVHIGDNQGNVAISSVKGRFDPDINTSSVDPIDISENLPDFLQDAEVNISVSNPTLKFQNLTNLPVGLNVGADLTPMVNGRPGSAGTVHLSGAKLEAEAGSTLYYYEGTAPFDPEGLTENAEKKRHAGAGATIASLLVPIPDQIDVEVEDKFSVQSDKEYTIQTGHTYNEEVQYHIYVPFTFRGGLAIVYRDSTESVNDDLKDYDAEGIRINATAQNTIPLDLKLRITAYDANGREVKGVQFNEITIPSGDTNAPTATPVEVNGTCEPGSLSQVDQFKFRIHAESVEANGERSLLSNQYIRLADIRLRLSGKVTADFN